MTVARKPYYVSFIHDEMPRTIDHTRSQPGPPGGGSDRAGYTSVTGKARLVIAWDTGASGNDRQVPIFARSVNVYFLLTDFLIAISSDYARRSCAYRVTLQHELEAHIYDPIRIFHSYRNVLVGRLNAIMFPTEQTPLHVAEDQLESTQDIIELPIVQAIGQTRRELTHELKHARDLHDSPESYRLVYSQCTDEQWASGK